MEFTANLNGEPKSQFHTLPAFESAGLEIRYLNKAPQKDEILSFNEEFLNLCTDQDLPGVTSLLQSRQTPILVWHVSKAVEAVLGLKDFKFLDKLVELGLDLSHSIFKGVIPRLVLACAGDDEEFESALKICLKSGAIVDDTENETYSTALHLACLRFDVGVVKILLKYGANPNAVNKMKMMPVNLVENEDNEEAKEILACLQDVGGQREWNNYMD